MRSGEVKVWDPLVRVLHWSLVFSVALAWLTHEAGRSVHLTLGYAALAVVAVRLVWGVVGSRHARFAQFVRGPSAVVGYATDVVRGRARRYLGHNPLGAAMIVALLLAVAGCGITGWLMTTDAYWGDEGMEALHEAFANGLIGMVALHVTGAVVTGLQHGENLVRAMFTGRKRAAEPGDVA